MLVSHILKMKSSSEILTVKPGTSLGEVVNILTTHRIGIVIVSPDGVDPQGIVSERDIIRELAAQGAGVLAAKVEDIMTGNLVTCEPDSGSSSVLERMTEGRFRHMPVMQDGEMIGLISLGDMVKAQLGELERENVELQDMIQRG